jgi:hypothetical protein
MLDGLQCDVIRLAQAFDDGKLTEADEKMIRFALRLICSRRANMHDTAMAVAILKSVMR